MKRLIAALTIACLGVGVQADLPLNTWRNIQPDGPENSLGGYAFIAIPQTNGQALLGSIWGNYYRRSAANEPWQPVVIEIDGAVAGSLSSFDFHPTAANIITAIEFRSSSSDWAVVRSQDGGATWTYLWQNPSTQFLGRLAVDPSNTDTIYVQRGDSEILRTLDGGLTWEVRSATAPFLISPLRVDPGNADLLYAIDENQTPVRSDDGGQTFVAADSGISTDQPIEDLAVDYNNPGTVYATSSSTPGLYKSTDSALTWTAITLLPANVASRQVVVDPSDSARLLVLTVNSTSQILQSTDAGVSWQPLPDGGLQQGRITGLRFASDGSGMAFGFSGISTIGPNGLTFDNAGFNDFEFSNFRLLPGTEDQFFGGRLQGLARTSPAAPDWSLRNADALGQDVRDFSIDPTNPDHLVASNTAVFETFDGGLSWLAINAPVINRVTGVGFSGVDPNIVHVGDIAGMLYSADGGNSWQRSTMNPALTNSDRIIIGSPHDASVAVMHLRLKGVWHTDDAGASWSRALGWDTTRDVAFDPLVPGRVYAAGTPFDQSVFAVSTNSGRTWTFDEIPAIFDGDIEHLAVDPLVPGRVYARTADSLYALNPRTQEWSRLLDAAPALSILFNRPASNGLAASTHLAGRLYQAVGLLHDIQLDSDDDGIGDFEDNCILTANAPQRDTDSDGIGNACDADIAPAANDCIVNVVDLGALRAGFFATPGDANWNPDADFNGDDTVNVIDLGILRSAFFQRPGFAASPVECAPVE